ncbi:MAG: phosphoribosylformylglycinamidine synthase subunit PurQ, partial [Dehalococcoidia bacterium]
ALSTYLGQEASYVWHRETDLSGFDCIVLPGGFSYGDHLRCGAIARFSQVMSAVMQHAESGKPVLGICNGFQILCEAGLLPGVLMRNDSLQFRCEWVHLRTETGASPFTSMCRLGQVLRLPIAHGEGNYYASEETLNLLKAEDRIAFRYCSEDGDTTRESNPNGSLQNIAGILNQRRNVLGMMPHPERASEHLMGGEDGAAIWTSLIQSFVESA